MSGAHTVSTQPFRIHCGLPSLEVALSEKHRALIEHTVSVLRRISRTFRGESNVDSSPDKEKLLHEGPALTALVERNVRRTLSMLFSIDAAPIGTADEVKQLLAVAALRLNEDLVPPARNFWRTWHTPFAHHAHPDAIKPAMRERFYPEFSARLRRGEEPVAFAVWNERTDNGEIHPLADGCGRRSKVLSAWILGRAGLKFPSFASRDEYFAMLLEPTFESAVRAYRERVEPV
jgi:hypothetical protein